MPSLERIVCAIRGGISSRNAEERAVTLASERKATVVFVHIIDPALVLRTEKPLSEAVLAELEYMGVSFLCIAEARAHARNVSADRVVLHGPLAPTLEKFLGDTKATTLVIGSPDHDTPHQTFSTAHFDEFVDRLRTTLKIDVQIV